MRSVINVLKDYNYALTAEFVEILGNQHITGRFTEWRVAYNSYDKFSLDIFIHGLELSSNIYWDGTGEMRIVPQTNGTRIIVEDSLTHYPFQLTRTPVLEIDKKMDEIMSGYQEYLNDPTQRAYYSMTLMGTNTRDAGTVVKYKIVLPDELHDIVLDELREYTISTERYVSLNNIQL